MEIRVLSEEELPVAFAIRRDVFVDEQHFPVEEEFDERDATAVHACVFVDGTAVATARLYADGDSMFLGRICVRKEHRKKGYGAEVCRFLIQVAKEKGAHRLQINAQMHAVPFYETLGFKKYDQTVMDAGILHQCMELFV